MRTLATIGLLAILFCLSSCIKEVDYIELPDDGPYVLTAFLSPQDEEIRVTLSKSLPVIREIDYDQEIEGVVSNGVVHISNGQDTVQLAFNPDEDAYMTLSSAFPIEEGKQYWVWAEVEGTVVSGSCVIPVGYVPTVETSVDSSEIEYYGGGSTYDEVRFRLRWPAPSVGTRYYRVHIEMCNHDDLNTPWEARDCWRVYPDDDEVFSSDGGTVASPSFNYVAYSVGSPSFEAISASYNILLVDEHYHNFHESLFRNYYSADDPFSEPSPVYSNIENGIGVVSGFTKIAEEQDFWYHEF